MNDMMSASDDAMISIEEHHSEDKKVLVGSRIAYLFHFIMWSHSDCCSGGDRSQDRMLIPYTKYFPLSNSPNITMALNWFRNFSMSQ